MVPNVEQSTGLPEIRSAWPELDVPLDGMNSWVEVMFQETGTPASRKRDNKRAGLDELFGEGNWGKAWHYGERIIGREDAYALYEEAYYRHLKNNPLLLEWLCTTASDVYDNSPSNVDSGLDYSIQEMPGTHMQDIAVRRSLVRLGRRFEGDHLVEIRGKKYEGYRLNPGQVPFHEPDEIWPDLNETTREFTWWLPDSIEAFWQMNKAVFVNLDALRFKPLVVGPPGVWCELADSMSMLLDFGKRNSSVVIAATPIALAMSSLVGKGQAHLEINNAPELEYAAIKRLSLGDRLWVDLPGLIEWEQLVRRGRQG